METAVRGCEPDEQILADLGAVAFASQADDVLNGQAADAQLFGAGGVVNGHEFTAHGTAAPAWRGKRWCLPSYPQCRRRVRRTTLPAPTLRPDWCPGPCSPPRASTQRRSGHSQKFSAGWLRHATSAARLVRLR